MSAALVPAATEPTVPDLIAARPHLRMHAMDGLMLEGVPLNAVADALGTPVWVYGAATLRQRYRRLATALADVDIHYAVKANDHLAILHILHREGAGADVVSGGEFLRARAAGIPADDIVFSGVGKSAAELETALGQGVGQVNVESAEELDRVDAVARGLGVMAPVVFRLNPDVDAGTHAKITTGRLDNKFGVAADVLVALYRRAATMANVAPCGVALHIGSQVMSMAPFRAAYATARELIVSLRAEGLPVAVMDCGGGLGIDYGDGGDGSPEAWAGAIRAEFGDLGVRLMVEPGRWLVGPCGVLLATVAVTKSSGVRDFLVLDAAMNDLVRPAMYDAWHAIVPLSAVAALGVPRPVDVVGPVCETGDSFARARPLPPLRAGARVALLDAGAYGAVMSATYNARPLAPVALVDGDAWETIRPRQPVEAMWASERIPEFLR